MAAIVAGNRKKPAIELRRALQIAGSLETTSWLLRPYIERRSLVLMIGAEGTFKSFLALHWAMQIASVGEAVVFVSAEGRGLSKRLRAWCKAHQPSSDPKAWIDHLADTPFYAIERPLNFSDADTLLALQEAIDAQQITPALIVVDTLTRNSDGLVERSNEDFLRYLNLIDNAMRIRYGASVLLVHHVGHAVGERARGPSAISQATDANFLLSRPDPQRRVVTVKSGRMKDCEPPLPFEIEADVIELAEVGEDGKPETSLALRFTGNEPVTYVRKPTGKHQLQLLAEIERRCEDSTEIGIWTLEELRKIARGLDMEKSAARAAVLGLQNHGYFVPTIGGSKLQFRPPGTKGENREKNGNISPAVGEKRERDPLGLSLSPCPASLNGASHEHA